MAGKRQQAARELVPSDFAAITAIPFDEAVDVPAAAPAHPEEWVVCADATVAIPLCGAVRFARGERLRDLTLVRALESSGVPVKAVS